MPAVVAVQEAVQRVVPAIRVEPEPGVHPDAVALIVAFEIGSRARYDRSLRWPIWPGGASGVTWCIGYDGGHQPRATILRDWRAHEHVERLAATSGITGTAARALIPGLRDVLTEYPYCEAVFRAVTLPAYAALARRTFAAGWDQLPWLVQGVLTSLVYNRGGSLHGATRTEMAAIARDCVPRGDLPCIARQIRAMSRLWVGTPLEAGLTRRRYAEAALVERAHVELGMAGVGAGGRGGAVVGLETAAAGAGDRRRPRRGAGPVERRGAAGRRRAALRRQRTVRIGA